MKLVAKILTALACLSASHQTLSQTYPDRPIKIVVPLSAGSSTDAAIRVMAPKLSEMLGQPIVVENLPGAGGNRGSDAVAKSAPDGYTLVVGTSSSHVINVSLYNKLPYDAVKDFAPITLIAKSPFIMMAHPSLGVKSMQELVRVLKAKPGEFSYSSNGNGTGSHLAMEMFKTMTGTKIQHIPYGGGAQANADLLAGHVMLHLDAIPVGLPMVRSGKVVGLGVTSTKRISLAPEFAPISDTVPGFEFEGWIGLLAPAGTPSAVVSRLHSAFTGVLALPDIKERVSAMGWEVETTTPQTFGGYIKKEIDRFSEIVKSSGARVD